MTQPRRSLLFIATALIVWGAGHPAGAKRGPVPVVEPVTHQGVRYRVVDFESCREGGCIEALDATTGQKLWSLKVYCPKIDSTIEEDVQWVFISALAIDGNRLLVTHEDGGHFSVDLATREVSGDARGCDTGACSYGRGSPGGVSTLAGLLLALGLLRRR
jgi:hypothetical protein